MMENLDHRTIAPKKGAEFKDAKYKAEQYGGNAKDYSKQSSHNYKASDGTSFEIHSVKNKETGKVYEHKTKINK